MKHGSLYFQWPVRNNIVPRGLVWGKDIETPKASAVVSPIDRGEVSGEGAQPLPWKFWHFSLLHFQALLNVLRNPDMGHKDKLIQSSRPYCGCCICRCEFWRAKRRCCSRRVLSLTAADAVFSSLQCICVSACTNWIQVYGPSGLYLTGGSGGLTPRKK